MVAAAATTAVMAAAATSTWRLGGSSGNINAAVATAGGDVVEPCARTLFASIILKGLAP